MYGYECIKRSIIREIFSYNDLILKFHLIEIDVDNIHIYIFIYIYIYIYVLF